MLPISTVNAQPAEDSWAYFDTNSVKLGDANANLQRLHGASETRERLKMSAFIVFPAE